MKEQSIPKEISLKNDRTFILGIGYEQGNGEPFGYEADDMVRELRKLFRTVHTEVLYNTGACRESIEASIAKTAGEAHSGDTFILYYSGHGIETAIQTPNKDNTKLVEYPKQILFKHITQFPGRRIVILDCCQADYDKIPPNTLFVSATKGKTISNGSRLTLALICDTVLLQGKRDPLTRFVRLLLETYHNRPVTKLESSGRDDINLWAVYTQELKQHRAIIAGYQRFAVHSTLVEDKVPLTVNPRCCFLAE